MTRWKILIEEYNYEIKHINGNKNTDADLLSRSLSIQTISTKDNSKSTLTRANIQPQTSAENTILKLHDDLGHPGFHTFKKTLNNYINVKPYLKVLKNISQNCLKCNREKIITKKYCTTNWVTEIPDINETLCVDLKGPIKTQHFKTKIRHKYFYILVMTDWLTRYTEIKILFDTTSKTIISAITKKWTEIHGIPKFILSDNGRQFISVNFEKFCRENGIKHIFSGEYNPTGNSIVERRNLEIGFYAKNTTRKHTDTTKKSYMESTEFMSQQSS